MKKVFAVLLALTMVFVLLPAREARANYKSGDVCPDCGRNTIEVQRRSSGDSSQHSYHCLYCTYGETLYGSGDIRVVRWATEDCWGGTATCTQKAVCEGCGEEYGDYAPHTGGTATCKDKAVCSVCNQPYGDYAQHTPGEPVQENYTPATCQHAGGYDKVTYCTVCGDELSREAVVIGKLLHTPEEPVEENIHPATCQQAGSYDKVVYCTACGDELSREAVVIGKLLHTPGEPVEENVVPATCTADGSYDLVTYCTVCGDTVSTEHKAIGKKGHDLKKTDRKEPSCTEPGTEAYWTCQREGCGKLFSDAEGKHQIAEPVTIKELGHDLVHHDAKSPTCTAIGWDAYDTCSRCDYTTYAEKGALGHALVHHDAKAPTCIAIGWDAYDTCSRCDYTTYAEKGALDHDLVHHDAQDPTCTEIGWDAYDTCSRCDYTTYEELPALGHTFARVGSTITRVFYRCDQCGQRYWADNILSRNLLPGLVLNEAGENMEYTAGVVRTREGAVLNVTPEPAEGTVGALILCLTPEEVETWLREGIVYVRFISGEATLEIELAQVSTAWFPPLEDEIEAYLFTLRPTEAGFELLTEALVGDDRTPAAALTGLTLRVGDAALAVDANGLYTVG